MAQENFHTSTTSVLTPAQKSKAKEISSMLEKKEFVWEDMPDYSDLLIPCLKKAVELESKPLVLALLAEDYDLALRRAIRGQKTIHHSAFTFTCEKYSRNKRKFEKSLRSPSGSTKWHE